MSYSDITSSGWEAMMVGHTQTGVCFSVGPSSQQKPEIDEDVVLSRNDGEWSCDPFRIEDFAAWTKRLGIHPEEIYRELDRYLSKNGFI